MQNPLARAAIRLDPQRTVRPWPHACLERSREPDDDRDLAVHHQQSLLDVGLIENRNPPTPPAVAARREANDALFRGIAAERRRLSHPQRPLTPKHVRRYEYSEHSRLVERISHADPRRATSPASVA